MNNHDYFGKLPLHFYDRDEDRKQITAELLNCLFAKTVELYYSLHRFPVSRFPVSGFPLPFSDLRSPASDYYISHFTSHISHLTFHILTNSLSNIRLNVINVFNTQGYSQQIRINSGRFLFSF